MILRLIDLDITSIQITLDGTKEYHDQTRYLIGKKPTFDTIIKNLVSLLVIPTKGKKYRYKKRRYERNDKR